MKVRIERDEWWPVYQLTRTDEPAYAGPVADIDQALYERWTAANSEFQAVQDIIEQIYWKQDIPR